MTRRRECALLAIPIAIFVVSGGAAGQAREFAFHHLHLNDAGIADFYARLFPASSTSRTPVAGYVALRSGPMLLLFGRTDPFPAPAPDPSAIWHFGWGHVSLGETYLRHAAREVEWEPPLAAGRLHLHVLSRAPGAAAAWYRDVLNARADITAVANETRRRPAARPELRAAEAIVYFGELALAFYRIDGDLASTRGRRVDHIAVSCADLDLALDRLRSLGVTVLEAPAVFGQTRAAFIEGPDRMAIEIVERPASQ